MVRRRALALLCTAPLLAGADTPAPAEHPPAEAQTEPSSASPEEAELPTREEEAKQASYALELEVRQQALDTLQRDIEAKLEELARLRDETARSIALSEQKHEAELGRLVAFYASMKPKNAARLLEELPIGLAAEVIAAMKARNAGKILDSMESARAVQISRRVAGSN